MQADRAYALEIVIEELINMPWAVFQNRPLLRAIVVAGASASLASGLFLERDLWRTRLTFLRPER
jgi:hypothetical protein